MKLSVILEISRSFIHSYSNLFYFEFWHPNWKSVPHIQIKEKLADYVVISHFEMRKHVEVDGRTYRHVHIKFTFSGGTDSSMVSEKWPLVINVTQEIVAAFPQEISNIHEIRTPPAAGGSKTIFLQVWK